MTNRKCKIGKKAYAARRIAAVLMSATLAGTIAAGTPGIVQVSAASYSENADYIFEVLTRKLGYSEAAACGIMANIRCESTFNPHAWNAGGGSYGLCQWTGGRYGRLQSWCRSNGYDYTTIDGQLAYLEYELQNHYRGVEEYLRSVDNTSSGAYDAGQYYCYHFEAPASRGSVSVYRGGLASGTFWEAYRPAEWYYEDGVWRYIKRDGTYHKSWLTIDNKTYYLDENGKRISGWRTIDGNRYYFDKDGVMASGWVKIDGKDYYFGEDGPLITGLVMDGDSWFMLDESGNIQASEELEHYAGNWNEKKQDEALASANEQSAETESAEDTAAGADTGEQPLLLAAAFSSQEDNEEPSLNMTGLGIVQAPETTEMPSISSSGTVTVEDETDTEEAASAESTAEEAVTAENTVEETVLADSTAEEAAPAESTAEEAAPAAETAATAEEEIPESEIANTSETAAEAVEDAESVVTESPETAESAVEAAEEPQEAESADTAKTTTAAAAATEEAKEEALEADQADQADEKSDNASNGAGTAPSENTETGYEEFAAADALRAAAEATNEEAEEETPDGFFMIYDPTSEDNQSENASTQAVEMVLPQIDDIAEAAGTAKTPEISGSAITAETAETAEAIASIAEETAETAEAIASIAEETAETAETSIIEETAESDEKADNSDTANTTSLAGTTSPVSSGNVKITLSDEVIFLSDDEMDELVKVLDEKDLLQAVTKDGKDITDQLKADYERIDPRGNAFKVVFTVVYEGKTSSLESEVYVKESTR